jgi:subtilisin family serine protease
MLAAAGTFPLGAGAQTDRTGSAPEGPQAAFVPGQVLVRFRPGAAAAAATLSTRAVPTRFAMALPTEGREIPMTVESFGGSDIVEGLRLARVAPADTLEAVKALNKRADVLYAEPDYVWHKEQATLSPNDALYGDLWGLKNTGQTGHNDVTNTDGPGVVGDDIKAEQAWGSFTTGSKNIVVAVIDEGVDINHPDLQENIWTNPGEVPGNGVDDDGNGFVDDVHGWDFVHNDNSVFDNTAGVYPPPDTYTGDVDDHGTHVAGTIGARGNNGQGVVGVNWQVSIMPVKVLGKSGGSTSGIISGYSYVRKMLDLWLSSGGTKGANVRVTNNSYGGPGFSQAAFDAINALNGFGPDSSIIFVAAAGNEAENAAEFSHYPSDYLLPNVLSVAAIDRFEQLAVFSNYGPLQVALAAPGRGIRSTTPNNTYSLFSGTSMAAPHVAGAAALCLAAFPGTSAVALRNALTLSGDVLPSLAGKVYSQRRLNVFKALQTLAEHDSAGPEFFRDLRITARSGRAVTLAWTNTGDDGNTGQAALYVIQADSTFIGTKVPSGPAGTPDSVTVNVPYLRPTTSISIRARDNAGFDSGGGSAGVNTSGAAIDPYIMGLGAAEPLSTGGTPLGVSGDDTFKGNVPLPFAFPFYGEAKTAVTVSSNGALYFGKIQSVKDGSGQVIGLDARSSTAELARHKMIAGMWDDLETDAGGDVFMVQPDATRVIFRWQGRAFDNSQPVGFETELRSDGTIVNRYGAGNTGLFPVVGISPGEPDPYFEASHTSVRGLTGRISLTNAQTVTFTPRPSTVNVAPTVALNSPSAGKVFVTPVNISLAATASDPDGRVTKVDFVANGNVVAAAASGDSNFTSIWFNPAPGSYTLTAVATDDSGAQTTSAPVQIKVSANPIDGSQFFVTQHYQDFLNRAPDQSGLNFWTNGIESCTSPECVQVKRIDTSAAFFLSIEFQGTGNLVYKMYKASFGNLPGKPVAVQRAPFLTDTRQIQSTPAQVIVGVGDWQAQLEANKQAFALAFVQRPAFQAAHGGQDAAAYVNSLFGNAGVTPTQAEVNAAVNAFGGGGDAGRAAALRSVAESNSVSTKLFNEAFVLMQYFGYLQRDPDSGQDTDFSGYNFWLAKLNQFGDFRSAEMVRAFIESTEYRQRFGQP